MGPILKYVGGKGSELPIIMKYVPHDYDRYIEPFVGGGALFFHLEPRHAVLGDLNGRLISFYREFRDHFPRLRSQLDSLKREYDAKRKRYLETKARNPDERVRDAGEVLYYEMRKLYNEKRGPWTDGALYYFINRTSYSGLARCNAQGAFNVPFGRYSGFRTEHATAGHARLLRNAILFEGDYGRLLMSVRQDDFVFLDPPYDCTFSNYGNAISGFSENDHRRLAACFEALPCRALMIIGKTPLTKSLYAGYIVEEYEKKYSVNVKNGVDGGGTHLVIANYVR